MGILSKIFTWWDGATIGTALFSAMKGDKVGTDAQGNAYYRSKHEDTDGLDKRWVIYNGANDASRVPPEWHGWLHHSYDELPRKPPAAGEDLGSRLHAQRHRHRSPPIARKARSSAAAGVPPRPATTKPGRRTPEHARRSRRSRPSLRSPPATTSRPSPEPVRNDRSRRSCRRIRPRCRGGEPLGTPMKDRVATLGLLNKRNNISQDLKMKPGESRRIGDVVVKLEACEKTAPWEDDPEEGAFVQVFVQERPT